MTARIVLQVALAERLSDCSLDELRVLDVLLGRLELGRSRYGHLDLSNDARDFRAEGAEELADLAIYRACDYLKRRDELDDRAECEAADSHRARVERGLAELRDADITEPKPRASIADFDHSDDERLSQVAGEIASEP